MRIVAGKFRGKKLQSPTTENVRPTLDKVKQAIFTKLQFFIENKVVLDLFSGSGALGIEALSRNAKEVIFVDKNINSVRLTKNNLKSINSSSKVLHMDFKDALKSFKCKFDLILLDPPYSSEVYEECLKLIYDYDLLCDDGIIVCERDRQKTINMPYFKLFDTKNYGTVSVDYFQKNNS